MRRLLFALLIACSLPGISSGAEILIKLGPAGITDNNAWRRLCPVAVRPDGWAWGAQERYPAFAVVRITDMTVQELEAYNVPDIDNVTKVERAIRKWKIDFDDVTLPTAFKNTIIAGGIPVVTKAQIISFIKRWIN